MLNDLIPSVVRTHANTFRILRGDAIVAFVIKDPLGGWKVRPNTSARRGARTTQPTPRKAFTAYFRSVAWAKPVRDLLPDEDV